MGLILDEQYVGFLYRLVDRLERLSADSTFAHQASGLRGSLLRSIEQIETGEYIHFPDLEQLIEDGFAILRQAAKEIGTKR